MNSTLIERGAIFHSVPLFQANVVIDGLLITGQNPASAADFGAAMVEALKK